MGQINGHDPDEQPLGTRGLAAKLREKVDGMLTIRGHHSWSIEGRDRQSLEGREVKDLLCQAVGEMIESELLALAIGWGKRFAELEAKLAALEANP